MPLKEFSFKSLTYICKTGNILSIIPYLSESENNEKDFFDYEHASRSALSLRAK
jgi:hypothetical protein